MCIRDRAVRLLLPLAGRPPRHGHIAVMGDTGKREGTGPHLLQTQMRATEVIETREVQERLPDRSVEILPPETGPEPIVEQPSLEEVKAPVAEEILVEPGPVEMATTQESSAIVEPARDVPSDPTQRITPVRSRSLSWAVAGIAALALLCFGAVVMGVVVGLASGIDISTLQLPTPGSSLLLVVSAASFVGAILMLALLLWARRRRPA